MGTRRCCKAYLANITITRAGEDRNMGMTESEYDLCASALLERLPPELRPAVSGHAWQQGHSDGYTNVLSILEDLVDTLEGPVKVLITRLQHPNPTNG
jgi:hypothetical protein